MEQDSKMDPKMKLLYGIALMNSKHEEIHGTPNKTLLSHFHQTMQDVASKYKTLKK